MNHLLHFGPGNFFRAHLAEYLFDAGGWSVEIVALRSGETVDGLAAQGYAYTLAAQGEGTRQIGVISNGFVAPRDPDAVLSRIAHPDFEVLSATVTEKGYHLDASGRLDLDDPVIAEEVQTGKAQSLIGYLAYGLAQRSAPVTVLSCDNRTGNGDALGAAVADFAKAAGLTISCDARFPNAMVDRITPATTPELRTQTGDTFAVPCEPFKEWVIEDNFANSRPDWPGVQWVGDVTAHEARKLRMLNGAHSFLAYAGTLAGYEFVHEAIADSGLRSSVFALMSEAATTLPQEVQGQAPDYAKALVERFANPHLNHALRQIAMDGTQKLPYRIVEPLVLRGDAPSPALRQALQSWIAFCRAETQAGRALQDPQAEALAVATLEGDFLKLIGADPSLLG